MGIWFYFRLRRGASEGGKAGRLDEGGFKSRKLHTMYGTLAGSWHIGLNRFSV